MALCIFNGNFGVQNDREAPVLARREGRKYLWGVSGGRPGRVVDAQAQRFQGSGTHLEQVSGKISRNCQRCSSSTSYQGRVVASILSGEAGWAKVVPAQPLVYGNVGHCHSAVSGCAEFCCARCGRRWRQSGSSLFRLRLASQPK